MATTPSVDKFMIAWIAALPLELAAAKAMLDSVYADDPEDFNPPQSDSNSYSWGKIGKHNIVLTCLPAGVYGLASAAEAAARLSSSLPDVRIGLLVGIAAGLTRHNENIRLGDVVVSQPQGTHGGVVQYDLYKSKVLDGKATKERVGFLNSPPRALMTALSGLQASFEEEESQVPELITQAFARKPAMRRKYQYPGATKDFLRLHEEAASEDQDNRRDDPHIHFGTIASANNLVKDAETRDTMLNWLADDNIKPIALEMEAAGLMNTFPCLVIRGICDYADSSKNDDWQRYAAFTAAAVAKAVLSHVNARHIIVEPKLEEVLREVQSDTRMIRHNLESHDTRAGLDDILNWLSDNDHSISYNSHRMRYINLTVDTGQWFLNHEQFQTWYNGHDRVLLCPGSPGAGKSIMASKVIDFIFRESNGSDCVVYVFCDYTTHSDRSRPTDDLVADLLGTLLRQMISQRGSISTSIKKMKGQHDRSRTRPSVLALQQELRNILMSDAGLRVYFVIDALDECDYHARRQLLSLLEEGTRDQDVHLLATSRTLADFSDVFPSHEVLEICAFDEDIRGYVNARKSELRRNILEDRSLWDAVVANIVLTSAGMFLLARLRMDSLREKRYPSAVSADLERFRQAMLRSRLKEKQSSQTREETLNLLYDLTYEDTMERIKSQPHEDASLATTAMSWILGAKRPLRFAELQHALAVRVNDCDASKKDSLVDMEGILSVCGGLLMVVGATQLGLSGLQALRYSQSGPEVRFVHYTTEEYFQRARVVWFPDMSLQLALACVAYTATRDFNNVCKAMKRPLGPADEQKLIRDFPLARYAGQYAGRHCKDAEAELNEEQACQFAGFIERLVTNFHAVRVLGLKSTYRESDTIGSWLITNDLVKISRAFGKRSNVVPKLEAADNTSDEEHGQAEKEDESTPELRPADILILHLGGELTRYGVALKAPYGSDFPLLYPWKHTAGR